MKYTIKIYPRAYRDLDEIYSYIAVNLMEQGTAHSMITALEDAIFSLEQFPERGSIRHTGIYADQGYRQIFVKNYTIIYRVHKKPRGAYRDSALFTKSILIVLCNEKRNTQSFRKFMPVRVICRKYLFCSINTN